MFLDESQISQFYAFCRHIRLPPNKRNSPRLIILTVKNAAKVMVWGAICANERCDLWFMPEGTSINGTVYLNVLKEKLPNSMEIYRCNHFRHDGAPCHRTKTVGKCNYPINISIKYLIAPRFRVFNFAEDVFSTA